MISFVRNLLLVPGSLLRSRSLLSNSRPDVVVGVGGYSSGPVVLAGWWLRIPTMIVEPNAYPGLANRLLAHFVDRAALAMSEAGACFGAKGVVTGIPVRAEFNSMPARGNAAGRFTVLVYGGSQGSHALNSIVCSALATLKELGTGLRIIHQTGDREIELVRSAYAEAGIEADIRPFLPRIYEEFAEADLIISRAGAGTVAEITAAGRAAILVPFPGAADDHQSKNARALESAGAAVVVRESEWSPGRLAAEIRQYMEHPERLKHMEAQSRGLAKPDAASRIVDLIESLATCRPPVG
jgi:UDP-N-acetylglucosamine--N-acetylmuramyl-(pentapeptide) pyrophosphoryl-undecaprenol N-acetylglucosamine transferase